MSYGVHFEIWVWLYLMGEGNQSALGEDELWGARCQSAKATTTHNGIVTWASAHTSRGWTSASGPFSPAALVGQDWNPCFDQEKLFCRIGGLDSAIAVTQGNSSITAAQINSKLACNLLGNAIIALFFVCTFMWFQLRLTVHCVCPQSPPALNPLLFRPQALRRFWSSCFFLYGSGLPRGGCAS